MGFESPPGRHFQNWADHSPRAETSTSLEGDAKDSNRVSVTYLIFLFMYLNRTLYVLILSVFQQDNGSRDLVIASGSSDHDRGKMVDSKVVLYLKTNCYTIFEIEEQSSDT